MLRSYNVASGVPHTVGEMAAELTVTFGGGPVEPVTTGEYRLGDVRHIVASPDAAAADLGFRARTSFAEGIAEFAHAPLRAPARQSSPGGNTPRRALDLPTAVSSLLPAR